MDSHSLHSEQPPMMPVATNLAGNSIVALLAGFFTEDVTRVWDGRKIEQYLLASDGRRHVWHAWFAQKTGEPDDPATVHDFLTRSKSRDIISDAFGRCPNGYVSGLKRLGPVARSGDFYRSLFRVLARGGALAQCVHRMRTIADEDVACLSSLPDGIISDRMIALFQKAKLPTFTWSEVLWLASRIVDVDELAPARKAMARSPNPVDHILDLIRQLPFPRPPFEARDQLVPVTSGDELAGAARSFRNCLADREVLTGAILAVLSGRRYFFRWQGERPALLAFDQVGSFGWSVSEASGRRNERLSSHLLLEITKSLEGEPSICTGSLRGGILRFLGQM